MEFRHRSLQRREALVAELREELGRAPTPDEVQRELERRLGRDMARGALEEQLGREPTQDELRDFLDAVRRH